MEGLPHDFGIEADKDDDDDDGLEKKSKKSGSLAEALKTKPEVKEDKEPKALTKESLIDSHFEKEDDVAPELDAMEEAPLKYLSKAETEAITQTMASERLDVLQEKDQEVTSESLAAESFLENVESSGDIDSAYNETLIELGETSIAGLPKEVEAEIAEPVDPESLVAAAKSELAPDISYRLRDSEVPAEQTPKPKPVNEADASSTRPERLRKPRTPRSHEGIVDYVVGRRFGRLEEGHKLDDIEKSLDREVSDLQLKLTARETHVRQLAQNRNFEKKPVRAKTKEARPSKAETIGKVLIGSKVPERSSIVKGERAAISAHTMKHTELLGVAQTIEIDNSNLKQIYEAHLVGEQGLRRIIAEYLRGGNFKKVLKREIIEREKDFERDPNLRDQASTQPVATRHDELDNLLKRSGIDWNEPGSALSVKPKVKGNNLPAFLSDIKSPANPVRRVVDIAMISVIVAMAVVISILVFAR
ncbi:MAG TPA: hypothetical protein VGF75_05320 [Candidatus Saccharimonadales bacterium]|jgi:hypothetical protein